MREVLRRNFETKIKQNKLDKNVRFESISHTNTPNRITIVSISQEMCEECTSEFAVSAIQSTKIKLESGTGER